uniref:Uncharacterized protein n=1 Tax=Octactis speculum TaxID=3111310 RepID=A0A7S2MT87_9STRA
MDDSKKMREKYLELGQWFQILCMRANSQTFIKRFLYAFLEVPENRANVKFIARKPVLRRTERDVYILNGPKDRIMTSSVAQTVADLNSITNNGSNLQDPIVDEISKGGSSPLAEENQHSKDASNAHESVENIEEIDPISDDHPLANDCSINTFIHDHTLDCTPDGANSIEKLIEAECTSFDTLTRFDQEIFAKQWLERHDLYKPPIPAINDEVVEDEDEEPIDAVLWSDTVYFTRFTAHGDDETDSKS